MACIKKRRGRWVADWRDAARRRRWRSFDTRRAAEDWLTKAIPEARQTTQPVVDPASTVAQYARHWITVVSPTLKPRTRMSYRSILEVHLLPCFGATKVRDLQRGRVKAFLAEKRDQGRARGSVNLMLSILRAMLNAAVEDGLLVANPTDKLGGKLKLSVTPQERADAVRDKAMTREQRDAFLEAAWQTERRQYPLWLFYFDTGVRPGEGRGVQWVDFETRTIHLQRQLSDTNEISTLKSGHGRDVDMSRRLAEVLQRLRTERKAETLRRGWPEMPAWAFVGLDGQPISDGALSRSFHRIRRRAKLPDHFTPHCCRHTFATCLLERGESPVYVQQMLGHSSIKMTVDTYGSGRRARAVQGGVDALAESALNQNGSNVVADAAVAAGNLPQPIDSTRARTAPQPEQGIRQSISRSILHALGGRRGC